MATDSSEAVATDERSENFGLGTFDDLTVFVDELAESLAPKVNFDIESDQDQRRLRFIFRFSSSDNVGLFLGSRKSNLELIKRFVRQQQIYPHDRFIRIELDKPDEVENQVFWDRNVSKMNNDSDS